MNGFKHHGINHLSASSLNLGKADRALWGLQYLCGVRGTMSLPAARGIAGEEGVAYGLKNLDASIDDCIKVAVEAYNAKTALSPLGAGIFRLPFLRCASIVCMVFLSKSVPNLLFNILLIPAIDTTFLGLVFLNFSLFLSILLTSFAFCLCTSWVVGVCFPLTTFFLFIPFIFSLTKPTFKSKSSAICCTKCTELFTG